MSFHLRTIHKVQTQDQNFKKEQKVSTKSKQAFEKTRNSELFKVTYNGLPAVIKTLPNDVYGKYEVRQCQLLHTIAPQYTLPVFSVQAQSSHINLVQPEYGISLYAFIYKRQAPLSFRELKYVYQKVATALSRFHEAAGIAHLGQSCAGKRKNSICVIKMSEPVSNYSQNENSNLSDSSDCFSEPVAKKRRINDSDYFSSDSEYTFIPMPILAKILSYIEEAERLKECQFVCKKWYNAVNNSSECWDYRYFKFPKITGILTKTIKYRRKIKSN